MTGAGPLPLPVETGRGSDMRERHRLQIDAVGLNARVAGRMDGLLFNDSYRGLRGGDGRSRTQRGKFQEWSGSPQRATRSSLGSAWALQHRLPQMTRGILRAPG
eukprot:11288947-Alexandrium_andersonii.AAC.1